MEKIPTYEKVRIGATTGCGLPFAQRMNASQNTVGNSVRLKDRKVNVIEIRNVLCCDLLDLNLTIGSDLPLTVKRGHDREGTLRMSRIEWRREN